METRECRICGGDRDEHGPIAARAHNFEPKVLEASMSAKMGKPSPEVCFAVGGDSMGWRTVWVVDEHGCELHTEPVCSYHVKSHPWFENWILAQEVPNQHEYPALLWHPVLGETSETYKDKE